MDISFLKNNITRFNKNTREKLNGRLVKAWMSEVFCFIRFGSSPDDYFRYEFYRKSNLERDKFLTYRRSRHVIETYNKADGISVFFDKANFNRVFAHYIKREWLDLRAADEEQFLAFLDKHKRIIMKPMNGGQGRGVFIMEAGQYMKGKFAEYKNFMAEELLVQHDAMATLNPTSVNTVRVVTFRGNIIACGLKIGGTGSPVDNFHISDGICAHLDIKTGVLDVCIDNAMNKYMYHPETGLKLVGFEIPHWDIVQSTIAEAVKLVPNVEYIGWDVAILPDGVALIEGNHDPGHDIAQMVGQNGIYEKIKQVLK